MRLTLLDTSALYASLDSTDRNYHYARLYLEQSEATYVVVDTVFSEAMTLIKAHLGAQLAVKTGNAIISGAPFRLHRLTGDEADDTWRIFARYADKAWSFTDCSVLALARRSGIGQVFAFDRHFDQMAVLGLRRVP
jgi:uncharacterized protein